MNFEGLHVHGVLNCYHEFPSCSWPAMALGEEGEGVVSIGCEF